MSHHIYFRILGYLVTIAMHTYNIVVMVTSFHGEPMKNSHVKHFSEMQCFFFTCWTFTFQILHAVVALYTDLLVLKSSKQDYELPKLVTEVRDALFTILVWPSTVVVFTLFWSFFLYDRSLLFPEDIDLVITKASNHIMHTFILPVALWEVLFRRREPPKSHKWRIAAAVSVDALYFCVVLAVYAVRGVWVYPVFGVLTGSIYFYLFFIMVAAMLPIIYHAQWALSSLVRESRGHAKKMY